jgi:hypothetical protein
MLGDDVELLRRDYRPRLLAYLTNQDEGGRRSAYELGRQALTHGVGLLVLVRVHNEVFLEVIATARTADAAEQVARAVVRDDPARLLGAQRSRQRLRLTADGPFPPARVIRPVARSH